jgi:hypothetical protein
MSEIKENAHRRLQRERERERERETIQTATENFSERRREEKHGRTDRQIDRCDVDRQTDKQVGRHTDK